MADNITVIDSVKNAVVEMKSLLQGANKDSADTKAAVEKINDRLDSLEFQTKKMALRGTSDFKDNPEDVNSFADAMMNFKNGGLTKHAETKINHKRGHQEKSTNMVRFDIGAGGALLMPTEMSTDINKQIVEISDVLPLVTVRNTNGKSFTQARRDASLSARWLAEAAVNTKTRDTFGATEIFNHKIAAYVGWSIEQTEDSAFDVVREVYDSVREQFDLSINAAFINGDGVGKPHGMVGNVGSINSGSTSLSGDMLINMVYEIKSFYRNNASWLMNRQTMREIRKLTIGSEAFEYLWEQSFQVGQPSLLLGAPIHEAPTLIAPVAAGTFTVGQAPILFGDFKYGYTATMGTEFYVIEDRFTEASAFITNLNVMSRVGGDVVRSEAIVQLTIS